MFFERWHILEEWYLPECYSYLFVYIQKWFAQRLVLDSTVLWKSVSATVKKRSSWAQNIVTFFLKHCFLWVTAIYFFWCYEKFTLWDALHRCTDVRLYVRLKWGHSFVWLGSCNNLIKSLRKFFRNRVCDIKRKKGQLYRTILWYEGEEKKLLIGSLV